MNRKLIKQMSKQTLNGKYPNAIGFLVIVTLITFCATALTEMIPFVGAAATIFISAFVAISNAMFYKKLSETGEKIVYRECLPNIELSLKFICCTIVLSIITTVVLIIPICLSMVSLLLGLILIIIVTLVVSVFLVGPTEMLPYILLDNPQMSVTVAFKLSFKYFFDNFSDVIMLILSFIPLVLLIIVTFGIAALWIDPYMSTVWYYTYMELSGQSNSPSGDNYFYNA